MSGSKSQAWVIGTVFVALVILVGTWFLLVSPKQQQTQEARDANDAALMQQDQLRQRLLVLQEQFEHIEEYEAELAAISEEMPADPMLADYLRSLDSLAIQSGVTIVEVSPGTGLTYAELVGSAGAAPAPTATDGAADGATDGATDPAATPEAGDGGTTDGDATATPAPTAPAANPALEAGNGLIAIPFSVVVLGGYANTNAFLDAMQNDLGRLFLVTGLDALAQEAADNTGTGRPATQTGDVELRITGVLWQYVDPEQGPPVADEEDGETPTTPAPLPTTDRNPFAPITG